MYPDPEKLCASRSREIVCIRIQKNWLDPDPEMLCVIRSRKMCYIRIQKHWMDPDPEKLVLSVKFAETEMIYLLEIKLGLMYYQGEAYR